jgi:hypothetical protein
MGGAQAAFEHGDPGMSASENGKKAVNGSTNAPKPTSNTEKSRHLKNQPITAVTAGVVQTFLSSEGVMYCCPCCGFRTVEERGFYEICSVCIWEDDGKDDPDADFVRCGPNGLLSLTQARMNYKEFGACNRRFGLLPVSWTPC